MPDALLRAVVSGSDAGDYIAALLLSSNNCQLRDRSDGDPEILVDDLPPDEVRACVELIEAKHSEGVCDIGP